MKVLINLIPCEAPEISPASWCKKSGEASSSASADFLLEAEKRGSPPESEKRQLLARRGSGAGGAALLRKETSEINDKNSERFAESNLDSAILQNLWGKSNKKSLLKFLLLFAFAKRRVPLNHINFNPSSKVNSQNLTKKDCKHFHTKIKG